VNQKNFWEKKDLFPELDPCFEMGAKIENRIFGKNWKFWGLCLLFNLWKILKMKYG